MENEKIHYPPFVMAPLPSCNGRLNMLVFPRRVFIANIDASNEQLHMIHCKKCKKCKKLQNDKENSSLEVPGPRFFAYALRADAACSPSPTSTT